MSAQIYRTRAGDMLDEIAFRYYGEVIGGQVEAIIEANRSLDLGQYVTLPAGIEITLPEIEPQSTQTVRLFS